MTVETRTLDSYELNNVRFIKMDVEGHEVAVLRGAAETIQRNHPLLIIEGDHGADDIVSLVESWNYHQVAPAELLPNSAAITDARNLLFVAK